MAENDRKDIFSHSVNLPGGGHIDVLLDDSEEETKSLSNGSADDEKPAPLPDSDGVAPAKNC